MAPVHSHAGNRPMANAIHDKVKKGFDRLGSTVRLDIETRRRRRSTVCTRQSRSWRIQRLKEEQTEYDHKKANSEA